MDQNFLPLVPAFTDGICTVTWTQPFAVHAPFVRKAPWFKGGKQLWGRRCSTWKEWEVGGVAGLVSKRRMVRGPNTREHIEAVCLQTGSWSIQTAMWASVRVGDSKHKGPPKATEYLNTSKMLKSKVSSVMKEGGKKPKLGEISMYRTSPNPHLSVIWHLSRKQTFVLHLKKKHSL